MAAAEAEAEEQRVQATSADLLNAAARVVVEAPRGDGGRQNLGAHDSSLLQDDDEDEAHEFINADGTSRRTRADARDRDGRGVGREGRRAAGGSRSTRTTTSSWMHS